jgi:hypothetical protein
MGRTPRAGADHGAADSIGQGAQEGTRRRAAAAASAGGGTATAATEPEPVSQAGVPRAGWSRHG